jgi:hypothetical protein
MPSGASFPWPYSGLAVGPYSAAALRGRAGFGLIAAVAGTTSTVGMAWTDTPTYFPNFAAWTLAKTAASVASDGRPDVIAPS